VGATHQRPSPVLAAVPLAPAALGPVPVLRRLQLPAGAPPRSLPPRGPALRPDTQPTPTPPASYSFLRRHHASLCSGPPRALQSSASRVVVRAGPSPPLHIGVRHHHAMSPAFLAAQPIDELTHPGQVTILSSFPSALRSHTALTELRPPVSHPSIYTTSALAVPRRSPPPRLLAFNHRSEARSHCRRTPELLHRATPSGEEPSPPLVQRLTV
jgi:hypothetical protein